MLQFDEYKVKLNNIKPALEELSQALDLPAAERELDMLNSESAAPGFWDDLEKSQKVTRRMRQLENKLEAQRKREREWDDLMTLCEMGNEEEDESLVPELEEGYAKLEERKTCISMSSGRMSTSTSSGISGMTSSAAKEVCRLALASKGETRTSRWTPCSLLRKP